MMAHPRYQGRIIDTHCHLDGRHQDAASALAAAGIELFVNLWNLEWPPPSFARWRSEFQLPMPVTMVLGYAPDLSEVGAPEFSQRVEASIRDAADSGAAVLKVWKNLGLTLLDAQGERLAVDDCRLDVVWRTAGEVSLPIVIHIADPVAFFAPLDERNERLDELQAHPDWWFGAEGMPAFTQLIAQLDRVIDRHPDTTFIGAHMGCYAENLTAVGEMLSRHPNYLIDTSARIAEIGRRDPGEVHDFFVRYADRILFGSDYCRTRSLQLPGEDSEEAEREFFARYWRYFETHEQDLEHPIPIQGTWKISGIDLPDDVLEKLYVENAARVIPVLAALESSGRP